MDLGVKMYKIKNVISNNKYLILIFITLLLIFILSPISGDDFGNYVSTDGSLSSAIDVAKSYYYTLEGRFFGRIIIMFITRHKYIWNILTNIMLLLIINIYSKFFKQKLSLAILFIAIMFMCNDMFAQSYTWIAGSVTYLYPTTLSLLYFYLVYKNEMSSRIINVILFLLSIIIPMFVENIGCAFVFANVLLLVYYYIKNKKINKLYLINFIISMVVLIIMLLSPGSALRSLENSEFNSLNLFSKILVNIPNFNNYVLFKNTNLLIVSLIPINYYIIKKYNKKFAIVFNLIPLLSIVNNLYFILPMKFSFLQDIGIINTNNLIYLVFTIIYFIYFILSINYIIKNTKLKLFLYYLLIVGLLSSLVMLIIPVWGNRITLFTVITMIIISVVLIDNIYSYKNYNIIKFVFISSCIYFICCFICIYNVNKVRVNYINYQLDNNCNKIEVIRNPFVYLWNNNPGGDYFVNTYKYYMNIPDEIDIEIINLSLTDYLNIIFDNYDYKIDNK